MYLVQTGRDIITNDERYEYKLLARDDQQSRENPRERSAKTNLNLRHPERAPA